MKKILMLLLSVFILISCWEVDKKYTEEYCGKCYISYFWGKWTVCLDKKITELEKKNIENNCDLKEVQ